MLIKLKSYAEKNGVPIIREESGKLLYKECETNQPKQILEIGTAIGYSGILMLSASKKSHLTTIEKNDDMVCRARKNFEEAGLTNRVTLYHEDAAKILENLSSQGNRFDFIFLDGAKGQYINYLPYLKLMLNKGGTLFADDIYFHGLVKSQEKLAHKNRSMIQNLRKFISALENDKDLETEFLDLEDGISISRFKATK